MKKDFSHLDKKGSPRMVDVGGKKETKRIARAETRVKLSSEIIDLLDNGDIFTRKGPVFQTAVIAGIMAVKKTSDLIPLCHQLNLDKCNVDISISDSETILIVCTVQIHGKTGVEMEALTGASVAALTIYDMCKGFSHDILIQETKLVHKSGGKSEYNRIS